MKQFELRSGQFQEKPIFRANECVSIIVPVFNVQPFLAEALDSVIHQTYDNLEIIIVDDGSTDCSGELCDDYAKKDRRIIVIHQENKGLSAARNAGLDIMTGEVVAFLDPDDAYHPDYIRTMLEAMNRENVELVICKYTTHQTVGRMSPSYNGKASPRIKQGTYDYCSVLRAIADGMVNSYAWNKLYRSELWKDIRYPVGHVFEDVDTTYRIIELCHKVYVLDIPLYMYRKRPGSITEIWTHNNLQDWVNAYSHFESFIRDNTPGIFTDKQLIRWQTLIMSILFFRYGRISMRKGDNLEIDSEELRRMVIETGEEMEIKNCNVPTQICYKMICHCPWLYRAIFPGLDLGWQAVKKARGLRIIIDR